MCWLLAVSTVRPPNAEELSEGRFVAVLDETEIGACVNERDEVQRASDHASEERRQDRQGHLAV